MSRLFIVSARYPLMIIWLLGVAIGLGFLSINAADVAHVVLYFTATVVAFRFIQLSWREVQHGTSGLDIIQPAAVLFAIYLHKPYVALAASGALLVTRLLIDYSLHQSGKLGASQADPDDAKQRRLVRAALASQSPFTKLAARYSLPFNVMVLAIAVAAAVLGDNKGRALAVVLIGSPFALLYGSLLALRSCSARAYKFGITFRSLAAVERIADATKVIFGTNSALLAQYSAVAEVIGKKGSDSNDLLAHASGLLKGLKNADVTPFVTTVLNYSNAQSIKPLHIKHVQNSAGVYTAQYRGKAVSLAARASNDNAKYIWYDFTVDGETIGNIRFDYAITPSTATTLQRLASAGLKHIQLLTSSALNSPASAELNKTGVAKLSVASTPAQTLSLLAKNSNSIYIAATDAESVAVAESDCSILLNYGNNPTASEAADVLVLSPDISKVASTVLLAKKGFKIARSTTGFGFVLTLALISLAAFGLLTPLESSLLVLLIPVVVIALALVAKRRPNILDES